MSLVHNVATEAPELTQEIKVVKARTKHLKEAVLVKEAVARKTYANYGSPEELDSWVQAHCTLDLFKGFLAAEQSAIYVALQNDKVVGVTGIHVVDEKAVFDGIYVDVPGCGALLQKARLRYASRLGAKTALVRIIARNTRSLGWFGKQGFVEVDRFASEFFTSCEVVVAAKSL